MPETFIFNTVSEETVEASVIGLQLFTIISFINKYNYLEEAGLSEFIKKGNQKERWLMAGFLIYSEPVPTLIKYANDVAVVVYNYITNKKVEDKQFAKVFEESNMMLGFLGLSTQSGIALAFTDFATAAQIKADMERTINQGV